jgi:hypothetical protein
MVAARPARLLFADAERLTMLTAAKNRINQKLNPNPPSHHPTIPPIHRYSFDRS